MDVTQLIQDHQGLLTWLAKKNNNAFSMQLEEDVFIQTDPKQLIQALIQIILNAGKYTTNGSIKLIIKGHGQHVIFDVQDTGQGMPQDEINQVLTSIDQNDMRLVDAFSTLGLGLVVVHRFCRNSQSKLICTSQKSQGTTIQIIHPIAPAIALSPSQTMVGFTNNQAELKSVQASIQRLPGWGAQLVEIASVHELAPVQVALIDLDIGFNAMAKVMRVLKSKNAQTNIILFYNHRFIAVSACLKLSKDALRQIDQWLPSSAQSLICDLDSEDDRMMVANALSNRTIEDDYSYRHSIDARIISLNKFKLSIKEPVILIIDSIQSLKDWITEYGQPDVELNRLNLFSDRFKQ